MSDAIIGLLGVIVGGFIGIFATLVAHFFEYKKWKSNHKINLLNQRKERLEFLYKEAKKRLIDFIDNETEIDINLVSDFVFAFPQPVKKAFGELLEDRGKNADTNVIKAHYAIVVSKMEESLDEIDKKIAEEIE